MHKRFCPIKEFSDVVTCLLDTVYQFDLCHIGIDKVESGQ